MRVALGTLDLDEDTRKKLGKVIQGSSYLKRDQARDWALGLIEKELDKIRDKEGNKPAVPPPTESNGNGGDVKQTEMPAPAGQTGPDGNFLPEPPTAPPDAGNLPEPAPPTGAAGGTTPSTGATTPTTTGTAPSTGDLGSAGVPGGPA